MLLGIVRSWMSLLASPIVAQFENLPLGFLEIIGIVLLPGLSGLGLSVLLWFRNRAGTHRRRTKKDRNAQKRSNGAANR